MKKFIYSVIIVYSAFFIFCVAQATNEKPEKSKIYKNSEIISLDNFLKDEKSLQNQKKLKLNKQGDVIYKGKVIITSTGKTINNNSISDSYLLLKIYLIANGAKPRKNCDESDYIKNGIYGLGCYILEP